MSHGTAQPEMRSNTSELLQQVFIMKCLDHFVNRFVKHEVH